MEQDIVIRGARQHNLKNIDVRIPRNRLVVLTGPSGSGKSSLAFDTLYAEGQRRYVESLSTYARQFLERLEKPDVDAIEGLSPAIAIEQATWGHNPRSTVGTVTEIYDYLRLLFARVGLPHCPHCNLPIQAQTVQQVVDQLLAHPAGTRLQILAPVVRGRKGVHRHELDELRKAGFVRARIDGKLYDLAADVPLARNRSHDIAVVIDRVVVRDGITSRLADSLELAFRWGNGLALVEAVGDTPEDARTSWVFSQHHACTQCGFSLPEVSPRLFSFNSPYGACPECKGVGAVAYFDPDLLVPDPARSLADGAVALWGRIDLGSTLGKLLTALSEQLGFTLDTPWQELPPTVQHAVLFGSDVPLTPPPNGASTSRRLPTRFPGLIPQLTHRVERVARPQERELLQRYQNTRACASCHGTRLRREALCVRIGGRSIAEVAALTIPSALEFLSNLELTERQRQIAEPILREATARLQFLEEVGLAYLSLDRAADTLSGGEAQRIRLASQVGAALAGVLYVLDEPSVGLHPRDTHRLLALLTRLRDYGNTVVVVEHDRDTILAADYVIDLGPGAGAHGGHVVAAGSPKEICAATASLTGQYLSGAQRIPVPPRRRSGNGAFLRLTGASLHNLRDVDLVVPLGTITCVTGVSGAGKSTLILDTLYPAVAARLGQGNLRPGPFRELSGWQFLDKVIQVDQNPIGRTPRSNPATYTGVFEDIRSWFAQLPEARARGFGAGRFSFNVRGGRCEACRGEGLVRVSMHFLPDVYVACDVCGGRRYERETLEVRYKGKHIADVLSLTVAEALEFFSSVPHLQQKLRTLYEVGLEYLTLGQPATTLSGGEAQRLKLAKELARKSTGKTLYVLDEPTTGLHFEDIRRLLDVLHRLVDAGNTVIIIEHNLDVIKVADYVIDMGPEGGAEGGRIVAQGTPEQIACAEGSYTGRFLRPYLQLSAR